MWIICDSGISGAAPAGACAVAVLLVFAARGMAEVADTTTFEGATYNLLVGGDFDQLEAEAVSLGGHLASINSLEENDFLAQWAG